MQKRSIATHAVILNAASQLFLEQGFHATSMRQVVARSGVTMGGIYAHFSGKEEIWQALILDHQAWQSILTLLHPAQDVSISDNIHGAIRRLVESLGGHNDFLNLILIEFVEFDGRHFPQLFAGIYPDFLKVAGDLFDKKNQLRDLPAATFARTFLSLIFSCYFTHVIAQKYPLPGNMNNHDTLQEFIDIYLNGILATEALSPNIEE